VGRNDNRVFISREKGFSVTYVILIVIAALLIGGLWYVRGRRA
jgi:uncharacterized membrane protein YecN with MAPEG domain